MEVLDKFNKHNIKHLLSLPATVADPAVYLLSGTLPIEAMIHHRVLTFFGNIRRLSDSTIEKRLAERQLAVKSLDSHSWFVRVKKLCIRYGLPDYTEIFKPRWKHSCKSTDEVAINSYWNGRLQSVVPLYPRLKWLTWAKKHNITLHPLIMSAGILREVPRIAVHFKIVTGTYILQSNRSSFNQNEVDPTCLLCKTGAETLTRFLLHFATLESIRQPILKDIKYIKYIVI